MNNKRETHILYSLKGQPVPTSLFPKTVILFLPFPVTPSRTPLAGKALSDHKSADQRVKLNECSTRTHDMVGLVGTLNKVFTINISVL